MAAAEKKSGFNTFAVAASALAALALVWVFALFLQGGFLAARARAYETKVLEPRDEELRDYQGEQRARLAEALTRALDRRDAAA